MFLRRRPETPGQMDWVKLATRYYLDPAVAALPDADTEVMFTRSLAYAGGQETAGFIPSNVAPTLCRKRRYEASAESLVAASLWLPVSGGWQIARWQEWQEELEALVRRRSADRDRKRRQREREKEEPQVNGMSRDMSADSHADSPPPIEKENYPPTPPPSGGTARCAKHKARPKDWCRDCQPPEVRPPWCGTCDPATRLTDPDSPRRCPKCHPLRDES